MPERPSATTSTARSAEQPTDAAAPPRVLRLTSPTAILKIAPVLLGFHPTHSVVILGAELHATVKVGLRYPLYEPSDPSASARDIQHALTLLKQQRYVVAAAIGYGPAEHVTPLMKRLRDEATDSGIQLIELLRADGMRYWSYVCTNPTCCPPEGTPYDVKPDPTFETLTHTEVPGVLASREALAALVAPSSGDEAASMKEATNRAEQRVGRLKVRARQSDDPVIRRHPIASAGIRSTRAAIKAYHEDRGITHIEAGWLCVALRDLWVRDDALSRMCPDNRQIHLKLWTDLTRLASPGFVAPPATLLTLVAWQSGNGALANVALDRALADDPNYSLAGTLRSLVNLGLPPGKAEELMSPREIAAWYRSGRS